MDYLVSTISQKYNVEWASRPENMSRGFLLFWGHTPSKNGIITKSCLSQWYKADFKVEGWTFNCMEQFMMANKARLFRDFDTLYSIMNETDPKTIKALGRKVKGFDTKIWNEHKYTIVCVGNKMKFSQNKELKQFLLSTGDKIIAEASPYDNIWGIKMSENSVNAYNPSKWPGENLLGFALMQVRDTFKNKD